MLILRNGRIVTGDKTKAPFDGCVAVEDDTIAAVGEYNYAGGCDDTVLDLHGALLMPGAIDAHCHAVCPGPRFASGTPGVSLVECLGNLRRHLTQGHTTVVNLDGFTTPSEYTDVRIRQPVQIEMATVHFSPMFEAADAADGSGLNEAHRTMTAQQMVTDGASLIGEVGAGMTLGGGGQDYMYIPAAVEAATGVTIRPRQATQLKYAVLGRHIREGNPDCDRLENLIQEYGMAGKISIDGMIDLISKSVLPSMSVALNGVVRSAEVAVSLGVPTLVHNAAASDEASREAVDQAGGLFIAGHTNHGTFTADEAVANARYIKQHGGIVEVDTFDFWGRRELDKDPANLIALLQAGVADIIATDYAAGFWDGMFEMVDAIVRIGLVSLQEAVAMATGNVANAIPRIGNNRGRLTPGYRADLVISDSRSPSAVRDVFIAGRHVLRNPLIGHRDQASTLEARG